MHARHLASRRPATVAVVVVARRLVPRMSRPSRYQTSALSQMGVKCLQYYTTSRDQRGTGVHLGSTPARLLSGVTRRSARADLDRAPHHAYDFRPPRLASFAREFDRRAPRDVGFRFRIREFVGRSERARCFVTSRARETVPDARERLETSNGHRPSVRIRERCARMASTGSR